MALIRSDCFSYEGHLNHCDVVPPDKQKEINVYSLYFIYNEDFGVTSFGFARVSDTPSDSEPVMMSFATEYILEGKNGLLKP